MVCWPSLAHVSVPIRCLAKTYAANVQSMSEHTTSETLQPEIGPCECTCHLHICINLCTHTGALSSLAGIFASATLSLADEPEVPTPKSKSSDSGEDAQVWCCCIRIGSDVPLWP